LYIFGFEYHDLSRESLTLYQNTVLREISRSILTLIDGEKKIIGSSLDAVAIDCIFTV